MDLTFIEGISAVVAAVLIFCGSVWLLLSMVMGPRLAYFVTASLTLGFVLIMGVVWSISPLGPIGQAAKWEEVAIGTDPAALDFGPAGQYPDAPWRTVNEDDDAEGTKAAELGSAATDYLEVSIDDGSVDSFAAIGDATQDADSVRLLTQGGTEYGATTFEPLPGVEGEPTVVVMSYDPGNPLGPARMITAGTFVLLAGHLFGLSRSEKRARALADAQAARR